MQKQLKNRIDKLSERTETFKKTLEATRNLRLIFGLLFFIGMIVAASLPDLQWVSLIVVALLMPFIYFWKKSKNLLNHIELLENWISFLNRQLLRAQGVFSAPDSFSIQFDSEEDNVKAKDLHLIGNKSILSMLDETFTEEGFKKLAFKLINPDTEEAKKLPKIIKSLYAKKWFLLKLKLGSRGKDQKLATENLNLQIRQSLWGPHFRLFFFGHLILNPVAWALTILAAQGTIGISPALPFTIYFFYFLLSKGQIVNSFQRTEELSIHLSHLRNWFYFIERHFSADTDDFVATTCQAKPSKDLKQLNRLSAFLSIQGHPIAYLALNILFPWDFIFSYAVEIWRLRWEKQFPQLLKELYDFEIFLSATFFYTYQTQSFAEYSDDFKEFQFKSLRHPLIPKESVVPNSWTLSPSKNLCLITGSNMSGKSTFLRSVGVNQQLALMGLPVFAEQFKTAMLPLYTCLQVTDNLEAGYSTFYYEVRQIAKMMTRAKSGESFIYLIDEIFRGTNNRERLIGSRSVVSVMSEAPNVLGFITSHDLELTQLESERPAITNWHFKDDVKAAQLTFSYKIEPGPCPTTNALKIMKNEGIPV